MSRVIAYDRPVKDLIAGLDATGHVTHSSYRKTSVTLHHNGGRLSHEGVLDVWRTREASAHFDSDAAGAIAQYVRVAEYAWATGSTTGNCSTISIEMANSTTAPGWGVSPTTWQGAARLAGWLFARVIGVRPSPSNFFVHAHWSSTDCAGPSVRVAWSPIMAAAQAAYDYFKGGKAPIVPPVVITPPTTPQEDTMKPFFIRRKTDGLIVIVSPTGVRRVDAAQWQTWKNLGYKLAPGMAAMDPGPFGAITESLGGIIPWKVAP